MCSVEIEKQELVELPTQTEYYQLSEYGWIPVEAPSIQYAQYNIFPPFSVRSGYENVYFGNELDASAYTSQRDNYYYNRYRRNAKSTRRSRRY